MKCVVLLFALAAIVATARGGQVVQNNTVLKAVGAVVIKEDYNYLSQSQGGYSETYQEGNQVNGTFQWTSIVSRVHEFFDNFGKMFSGIWTNIVYTLPTKNETV